MGTRYHSDNLDILQREIKDESGHLVYFGRLFNPAQNTNAVFQGKTVVVAASQIHTLEDAWNWSRDAEMMYGKLASLIGAVNEVMQTFVILLGPNGAMVSTTSFGVN